MTCASGGTQVVANMDIAGIASGGGFSRYVPRPKYQQQAVSAYLNSGVQLPPSSFFNASGRAYPDVSALGSFYVIYYSDWQEPWGAVSGTSASTPTWAGLAARLVDISLAKTGKPLGFMNPLLYQMAEKHPAAFIDITKGNNSCTETGCSASCKGFQATSGWDATTGLGAPNYREIEQYVKNLLEEKFLHSKREVIV